MSNKKTLSVFISLDDLPKIDKSEYISDRVLLKLYKIILLKGGEIGLLANYLGLSRRSVYKRLKKIIKHGNFYHHWHNDKTLNQINNIEELEKKLIDGTIIFSN